LLCTAVWVANGGYFALSLAKDLNFALIANAVAYLGSAFLPVAMVMIISEACGIRLKKSVTFAAVAVGGSAFLLAASGPVFGLYYRSVSLEVVNGVSHLVKVYGPLHPVYGAYLAVSFGVMVFCVWYSYKRDLLPSLKYAAFLAAIVLGNLCIWVIGQVIDVDFEFLSVSYTVTELLLLLVNSLLKELDDAAAKALTENQQRWDDAERIPAQAMELLNEFAGRAAALTAAERNIIRLYGEGMDVNQVAEEAFISIHTVRKHNANIYQKLHVGSRDELLLYIDLFTRFGRLHELTEQRSDG